MYLSFPKKVKQRKRSRISPSEIALRNLESSRYAIIRRNVYYDRDVQLGERERREKEADFHALFHTVFSPITVYSRRGAGVKTVRVLNHNYLRRVVGNLIVN